MTASYLLWWVDRLKSRYLINLTYYMTLFNRTCAPSTASIPSVRSSVESISTVLISWGLTASLSSHELSLDAYSSGQYIEGSGTDKSLIFCSTIASYLGGFHLCLLSRWRERILWDFSTGFISALLSLMVSSVGKDMLCMEVNEPSERGYLFHDSPLLTVKVIDGVLIFCFYLLNDPELKSR